MKRSLLFLTSILSLSAIQATTMEKEEKISTNKKQLTVRVHNDTGVDLDKVAVTFRFYEQQKEFVGPEKEKADKKFIEGTLTAALEDGKGIDFNSDNANYNGRPAKEHFEQKKSRKPYYVVLHKISAGRWNIPGTHMMLWSTRKTFKKGAQEHLSFKVISTKNRFGFPVYRIQPAKQTMKAQ